jgi:hypothetical protein
LIEFTLRIRAKVKHVLHIERAPKLIANTRNRTYPGNSYKIEKISPTYLKERDHA